MDGSIRISQEGQPSESLWRERRRAPSFFVLSLRVRLPGVTHSKFPSPANDYIEDRIDLNREFVPSPMSTEQLVVVGDSMRGAGLFDGDLVLFDRAKLPSSGSCVVALHEGELIVRRVQGRPPRVSLVATDGMTPPIWFGQGSDPEILGVVTVGVHPLVD